MSIEQDLVEKVRMLSPEQQRAVLEFAASLARWPAAAGQRASFVGIWDDLGVHVAEEDVAAARREAWRDFPRDPG